MPFTCALSGHRVLSRQFSKQLLQQQLRALLEEGADTFLCGMALGFDLICAETLTALRTQYRLRLVACIPCADQPCRFTPAQKQAYLRALSACDESVVLHERYVDGCMFERNRYMVDHADMLYACLERPTGGTLYTVNYADNSSAHNHPSLNTIHAGFRFSCLPWRIRSAPDCRSLYRRM